MVGRRPDDSRYLWHLPVPADGMPFNDGEVRPLLIEAYEEGLALQWLVQGLPAVGVEWPARDESEPRRVWPRIRLSDDRGGVYQFAGASGVRGRTFQRGRWLYSPGLPAGTGELVLDLNGRRFIVPVRSG